MRICEKWVEEKGNHVATITIPIASILFSPKYQSYENTRKYL